MTAAFDNLNQADQVAARLKLIANANRLRIMCRLLEGEVSVGDIESQLGIRQPTLSREIAKLRDEGVITARRQSKVVFYTLTDTEMRQLVEAVCAVSSNKEIHFQSKTPTLSSGLKKAVSFNPRPKFTLAKGEPHASP